MVFIMYYQISSKSFKNFVLLIGGSLCHTKSKSGPNFEEIVCYSTGSFIPMYKVKNMARIKFIFPTLHSN